ncbi:hypothetical protein BM221_001525 [Beauveria bassiana]|uniref:Uncharacterized protein n=1 Tax=Beauveria bassiana TaxID=176275 RepID=A0A2N6NVZ2_BEABA|nr:hypothetical protein BM221_001525 [Beauveria bassiana]
MLLVPLLYALGQQIQRTARQNKPCLVLAHCVLCRDQNLLARLLLGDPQLHLAGAAVAQHLVQPQGRDLVAGADAVIVGLARKRQRHDALLLEVGLVDARKRLGQDDAGAQVARLQGGVLARRALAVVVLGDDEPVLAAGLPARCERGDGVAGPVEVVRGIDLARLGVDGRVERVGGDVGQVALVLEPGPGGGDGVGGALAGDFDEHAQAGEVRGGERGEGLEKSETLGRGRNGDGHIGISGLGEHAEGGDARLKRRLGALFTTRRRELKVAAVGRLEGVGDGVEGGGAGKGHGGDNLGGGEKVHGFRVPVVAAAKVAVVRRQDGVGRALAHAVLSLPLADTRPARIRQQHAARALKGLERAVALERRANLLAAGGDVKVGNGLEPRGGRLLEERLDTRHVLVRRIRAAANQARRERLGPLLVPDCVLELGQRRGQVRRERAVDVRLQRRQVNRDALVILGAVVGLKPESRVRRRARAGKRLQRVNVGNGLRAARRRQVPRRRLRVGKDGRRRADLGAHVADGGHAGAAERIDAGPKILDNVAGAAADRQLAGEPQDNVLGRGPAAQRARQLDAENLGGLELPRRTHHGLDRVSAAHANRDRGEAARVGAVAVGAEHHQTRQGVVLQHRLKVKHLFVGLDARGQVVLGALGPDNQMVAVDARGDGGPLEVARHELQQCHLSRSVLHVDAVGDAAHTAAIVRAREQRLLDIVQVAVENLLGEGQALGTENATDLRVLVEEPLVGGRQRRGRRKGAGGGGGGESAGEL